MPAFSIDTVVIGQKFDEFNLLPAEAIRAELEIIGTTDLQFTFNQFDFSDTNLSQLILGVVIGAGTVDRFLARGLDFSDQSSLPDGDFNSAAFDEFPSQLNIAFASHSWLFEGFSDPSVLIQVSFDALVTDGPDAGSFRYDFLFPAPDEAVPDNWQDLITPDILSNLPDDQPLEGSVIAADDLGLRSIDGVRPASVVLIGTDAEDLFSGDINNDFLSGGAGTDFLTGLSGDDSLVGGSDEDVLSGGPGNDEISGGPGNDFIEGDSGNDNIGGGPGDDRIFGGSGDDTIGGGSGNDEIRAGGGTDNISGGPGDDSIEAQSGPLTAGGSFGNDFIRGGDAADNLGGGAGQDVITAGGGNDSVGGGEGTDTIVGGRGDDFLAGGSGNDSIRGGGGSDTINGGAGDDTLIGDDFGEDVFVFVAGQGGTDRVVDFEDGADVIRMRGFGEIDDITINRNDLATTILAGDQVIVITGADGAPPPVLDASDLILV